MRKVGLLSVNRLGWALAVAFGIFVYAEDTHAANRSPAIDRDAVWSEEEFKLTENLLQSRAPASLDAEKSLEAFFPGPGIDRAIRAALSVESPDQLPGFLVERLKSFSELASERIQTASSNPDLSPSLKDELLALRTWISRSL